MGRGHAFWLGVLGILLAGTWASATALPRPTVDYSADVVMQMSGHGSGHGAMNVTGKVYVAGDKERRESTVMGRTSVAIRRNDKKLAWVLFPARNAYVEHASGADDDPYSSWEKAGVTLTKLGQETVNGVKATKYRAEAQATDGHMDTGLIWLTKENIPVRMEAHVKGQESQLVIDYTNIRIGKQDAALFEVPAGYQQMAMPSAAGMPAGSGHGAAPAGKPSEEQMRQIREQMQQKMQEMMEKSPGK